MTGRAAWRRRARLWFGFAGADLRNLPAALRRGPRRVRRQLRRRARGRRVVRRDARRRARRRPVGRPRRRGAHAAVGARHDRQRLLDHQGDDRALRAHAGRPRRSSTSTRRSRATGRSSPRRGKEAMPVALPAEPHRRPRGDPQAAAARGALRLAAHDRRARRRDAVVGAGHRQRLSRHDLRLPGRRGRPPHRRPDASARSSATRSPRRSAPTSTSACRPSDDARVAEMVAADGAGDAGAGPAAAVDPESLLGKRDGQPADAARASPITARVAARRDPGRQRPRQRALGGAASWPRSPAAAALDGVRLLRADTIERAIEEQSYGKDLVLGFPMRWGLGFMLTSADAAARAESAHVRPRRLGRLARLRRPRRARELGLRHEQDVARHDRRQPRLPDHPGVLLGAVARPPGPPSSVAQSKR